MKDNENRLVEIETKLAFQEETVQELNNVIYKQQLQLDKIDTSSNIGLTEDIPPHY